MDLNLPLLLQLSNMDKPTFMKTDSGAIADYIKTENPKASIDLQRLIQNINSIKEKIYIVDEWGFAAHGGRVPPPPPRPALPPTPAPPLSPDRSLTPLGERVPINRTSFADIKGTPSTDIID